MVEARSRNLLTERTTMLVLGLIFAVLAIGFCCWLLFNLAVYALPCFVGVNAGLWSYHHGSGLLTAMLAGLLCAAATLILGQLAFATLKSPLARLSIAVLFAAPAAFAGFYAALGLGRDAGASLPWCNALGMIGALLVGGTALMRLAAGPVQAVPEPHQANDNFAVRGL
jgi:hypothetical protein